MLDIFIGDYNGAQTQPNIFYNICSFFGFLLVTGEPISVGDTFQYESQMVMREPIYALLIQVLRFVSRKIITG